MQTTTAPIDQYPVGTVITARPWRAGSEMKEPQTGFVTAGYGPYAVLVWFPALGPALPGRAHQAITRNEVITSAPLASRPTRELTDLAGCCEDTEELTDLAATVRRELSSR